MDSLIQIGDQSVRASEVEAVVLADPRAVMVATRGGQTYVAVYALVREAKAAKVAFEKAWDAWRATQP